MLSDRQFLNRQLWIGEITLVLRFEEPSYLQGFRY
jgi:hypothetical protein